MAARPQPLPVALTGTSSRAPARRSLAVIGIPILLAGTTALALAWNVFGSQVIGVNNHSVAKESANKSAAGNWSLLQTDTQAAPSVLSTPIPSRQPQIASCPRIQGWEPYIVHPTDSLYRLSVIYGVSIEQLQQANCLGDQTVIFPGQIISVPILPTDVPTPTLLPAVRVPISAPVDSSSSEDDNNQSKPPSKPNTPVPPTPKPAVNTGSDDDKGQDSEQDNGDTKDNKGDDEKDDNKKDDDKDKRKDKDKDKDKDKNNGSGNGKGKKK